MKIFKHVLILTNILLLITVLCFTFYWRERIVYIRNEFEKVKTSTINDKLEVYCTIYGDWKEYINCPISVHTFGQPYKLLISVTSFEEIKKVELLEVSVHYQSPNFVCKYFSSFSEKHKIYDKHKYYLTIKKFPIVHEAGQTIKVKYKLKITLKDRITEKDFEDEFKATRKIEKSYIVIDHIMSV